MLYAIIGSKENQFFSVFYLPSKRKNYKFSGFSALQRPYFPLISLDGGIQAGIK
jgi:hypothetical protein